METEVPQTACRVCQTVLYPTYNFCPTCGLKVKEDKTTVSLGSQISVYLVSILLPPMGLFPGIKYLRKGDDHAKHVGLIAIFLTILSCVISIWAFAGLINTINNSLQQQVNLKQLGY